jgi:hypothetical protein
MERRMEDQLLEGGMPAAFDAFLDDITTFPAAILKGPVVRNKNKLGWKQTGPGQYDPDISEQLVLEWERVDPMMCYPSPSSTGIDDGYFIERHKLRQQDLEALIGVEATTTGPSARCWRTTAGVVCRSGFSSTARKPSPRASPPRV